MRHDENVFELHVNGQSRSELFPKGSVAFGAFGRNGGVVTVGFDVVGTRSTGGCHGFEYCAVVTKTNGRALE